MMKVVEFVDMNKTEKLPITPRVPMLQHVAADGLVVLELCRMVWKAALAGVVVLRI